MTQSLQPNDAKTESLMKSFLLSMLQDSPDLVFVKNTDLIYVDASQSFARLVGAKGVWEVVGKTDAQLFCDPDLARRYTDDDRRLLASGKPLKSYIEPSVSEGKRGFYRTSKFPLFDDAGALIGLYAISRDVTREYLAKLNYEQELRALFELPPNALVAALFDITNWRLVDLKNVGTLPNAISNYSSINTYIELAVNSVYEDEDVRRFFRSLSQESLCTMFESGKRHMSLEYCRIMSGGGTCWVRLDLHFLLDPVNTNLSAVAILHDIHEDKQAEHALTRAAEWDSLTDVYNRDATMTHIRRFLTEEGAAGVHWLFMIDVDNFKLVNDTFGHHTGDETLVNIAATIRSIFRETDLVGRVGGDEFFALMKSSEEQGIVSRRARSLVEALQYVCAEGGQRVELSASVGISRYAGDGKPLNQLYKEADAALYRAKQAGKNRFAFAESTEMGVLPDIPANQEPISTVHLKTLLKNMDAAMFQTELGEDGDIQVTYSSHSLFLEGTGDFEHVSAGARGENIWSAILPEDLAPFKVSILEATLSGAALDHTCRVYGPAGRMEWRHIRGSHLPASDDGVRRMIHVATDITRQKQTEDVLREKDSILNFAMRNTDVNLWYFDYEKEECQLTPSCQKIHHMPGVETLSSFPECLLEMGYIRGDCAEAVRSAYRQMRLTGESQELDVWYRKADESGWWCERDVLFPLHSAGGKVTRSIGIGKNVTAEKELEEKFHLFQSYRSLAEKNTLSSARMNLTTNWCGDYAGSSAPALELTRDAATVDDFFEAVLNNIPTQEAVEALPSLSRMALLEAFSLGKTSLHFEYRSRLGNASPIWLRAVADMMMNPSTGDVEALYYISDINFERNMDFVVDQLLKTDYEFLGLIDTATGRLMVFGQNMDCPELAQNNSIYEDEMQRVFSGLILEEYYDEGIRTMAPAHVMRELETKPTYTCSFPARNYARFAAGRKQWKFAYLDGSKSKILMARTDITSSYTAERDPLTGLYNRETFYRRTRETLNTNPECHFLVIRFDIDRFKAYNDACGVQAGDRLLASLGRSSRQCTWLEPSVFGRLEADHFVSLMPSDGFDVAAWHERQMLFFETAVPGYRLTSSVGIYDVTDREMDVSLMCDRALLALRTVKDSYTNKLAWYNESLRDRLLREQAMADEMELALRTGQFVLYFQPLVNYGSGSIIGAEALVRWVHPKHGLIPPDMFIPLFEKNGLIMKLDSYVWEKGCSYLRSWLDSGGRYTAVPISVNISRRDLYDTSLCDRLNMLVEKYNLPISMLKLEITESAYMDDPGQLIEVVHTLRNIGFIVEMDDFGAGYSSLNMLKDVPVDILKLDTLFLSESGNRERATTILTSLIRMAQELGLSVIAEGVETKVQADYLKSLGCFQMQGYYFGRPMPVEQYEQLITTAALPSSVAVAK